MTVHNGLHTLPEAHDGHYEIRLPMSLASATLRLNSVSKGLPVSRVAEVSLRKSRKGKVVNMYLCANA